MASYRGCWCDGSLTLWSALSSHCFITPNKEVVSSVHDLFYTKQKFTLVIISTYNFSVASPGAVNISIYILSLHIHTHCDITYGYKSISGLYIDSNMYLEVSMALRGKLTHAHVLWWNIIFLAADIQTNLGMRATDCHKRHARRTDCVTSEWVGFVSNVLCSLFTVLVRTVTMAK